MSDETITETNWAREAERPTVEAMLRVNREAQARIAQRIFDLAVRVEPELERRAFELVREERELLMRLGPAT